jgi:hypothetical protein
MEIVIVIVFLAAAYGIQRVVRRKIAEKNIERDATPVAKPDDYVPDHEK